MFEFYVSVGVALIYLPLGWYLARKIRRDPTDAWHHIFLSRLYSSGSAWPTTEHDVFPPADLRRPRFLPWLLYRFRPKDQIRFGVQLNFLFLLIEVIVTVLLAKVCVSALALPEGQQRIVVVVAACVQMLAPYIFLPWSGVFGLNARPFGTLLANLGICGTVLALTVDPLFGCLPVVVIPLLIVSSSFGVQAMVFGSLGLAVVMQSWLPVMYVIAGFCCAGVLRGRVLFGIVAANYWHLRGYALFLQYHNQATVQRCWPVHRWIRHALQCGSVKRVVETAAYTPMLRVLMLMPWLGAIAVYVWNGRGYSDLEWGLLSTVAIAIGLVPIISYRHFRFLGEPDRYVFFLARMPIALVLGIAFVSHPWMQNILYVFGILSLLMWFAALRQRLRTLSIDQNKDQHVDGVADFLRSQRAETADRVLCVPTTLMKELRQRVDIEAVGLLTALPRSPEHFATIKRLYPDMFPYPTTDMGYLRDDLHVRYLVYAKRLCRADYLKSRNLPERLVAWPSGAPCYENGGYAIYRCDGASS